MSDWPAPYSCSSAVPGPRRQSLKGCMGALPQLFQWSRMLGSSNKCIATTADVQTLSVATEKQPENKRWANQVKPAVVLRRGQQHRLEGLGQAASNECAAGSSTPASSSGSGKVRETDETAGMDLRQVLHAKQDPFVLQDVIREKRQPRRTLSSRDLKFGAPSTRRSLKMKDSTTSKDQEQAAEDGGSAACASQYCVPPKTPTGSATAVVRRNRVPVESMVAMPSYQAPAVCGVNSCKKPHSKTASQGRNPVKSPNKRALLMEAAARILEGSNRQASASKRPSTSVRSLLDELETSKHVKELSKPKEKLVRAVVLQSESSEREEVLSPNVVFLGEKEAERKQHQNSYDLEVLGTHNSNSSCKHHFEVPQILEKDLLIMQNRVFTYENALDEAEALPSLATPVQILGSENKSEHMHLHDDLWSGMKGTRKETMSQTVRGFKLDSSEVLPQAKTGAVHPEVIMMEDQHTELDHDALFKDSRAIVPSTAIDSAADFPPVVLSTCLPRDFDNASLIIRIVLDYSVARHLTWGYHAAAPFPAVNNPEESARSTGRSLIEGSDETGHNRARDMKAMEAERQSSDVQLRLCNYSWWANSRQNNAPEKREKQLSTEYCAGYDSPVAAPRSPCFVKVWNAEMREDCEEEGACASYVDEFQQASPVSVLEPVYEEDQLQLGNSSFDDFEEARQKLLEKVRRYEMLAHMDVDMLKKVSEENASYAWDDDNESWESDIDSEEPHDVEESLMYHDIGRQRQQVEMRSPSSSLTRKLEPRPLNSCRVLRLDVDAPLGAQRFVSAGDEYHHIIKEEVPANYYVVNSLLHVDLATSNWSSFKQEEVQVELESCFFELLMCELLSDLLKAQFKPFCNCCMHFNGNPVHRNRNCS